MQLGSHSSSTPTPALSSFSEPLLSRNSLYMSVYFFISSFFIDGGPCPPFGLPSGSLPPAVSVSLIRAPPFPGHSVPPPGRPAPSAPTQCGWMSRKRLSRLIL